MANVDEQTVAVAIALEAVSLAVAEHESRRIMLDALHHADNDSDVHPLAKQLARSMIRRLEET
jgi:hypothetical protein